MPLVLIHSTLGIGLAAILALVGDILLRKR
jgi:hypothetical protein